MAYAVSPSGKISVAHTHATSSDQLQIRDQARREVNRPDLRAVPELEHHGYETDRQCREQLIDVVLFGNGDVADDEPEVQRGRQQHEKSENDLLKTHGRWCRSTPTLPEDTGARPRGSSIARDIWVAGLGDLTAHPLE